MKQVSPNLRWQEVVFADLASREVEQRCPCRAGTAMHHAAMANKREMMLTLARLGCDYRAKADGIEGATATFVLCGQHGKTTQQQVCSCRRFTVATACCHCLATRLACVPQLSLTCKLWPNSMFRSMSCETRGRFLRWKMKLRVVIAQGLGFRDRARARVQEQVLERSGSLTDLGRS